MANVPPSRVPAHPISRTIPVRTTPELRSALLDAQTGDEIQLHPGEYRGPWIVAKKVGITLTGPGLPPENTEPPAVLLTTHGGKPCLHLQDCQACTIRGIVLTGGQKGLMVDRSSDCVLDHLDVGRTKMEAVHFRQHSVRCTIQFSLIHDTGLGGDTPAGHGRSQADDGEGVYVGSALSNSRDARGEVQADRSDYVRILYNRLWNCTCESIDIKECTVKGQVVGNAIDGGVARSRNHPAMIELKGSEYLVQANTFTQPTTPHLVKVFAIRNAPASGQNNHVLPDNQAQ